MPQATVRTTWEWSGQTQEILTWSKHTLQYRKWRNRLTWPAFSVWRPAVTKAENSLSIVGKMKNIVVWLSTSSRVSRLQVWKQMHSWLSLPFSTSLWWEHPQREVEKTVLKDQLLFLKKKKDPMNSVLRKAEELGLNASAGHTWNSQDAADTKLNSGKKKAIWRDYPKRWTSWAKSLRAQFGGTTTWGNHTTSRL